MKLNIVIITLVVALFGCSSKPTKPVSTQPLTAEQIAAKEAQRKANEELLRKNNEQFQNAYKDHPESFSH